MAKTSSVYRNLKRAKMAEKFASRRNKLKKIVMDKTISPEERFQATLKLAEMPRNSAKIREESLHKPVIITVRGEPTNVLLSYKEYVRVFKSSDNRKIATELFAHKKAAYCDLESELVRNKELVKAPEFD